MNKILAGLAIFAVMGFLLVSVYNGGMRDFGQPGTTDMDDYYLHNGQNETAANNIVTSIVFDYRGFDTIGEATVLFTAVIGVVLVFRRWKQ